MTGLELEVMYQVSDAWDVMATYGYLKSEYANYVADLTGDGIITDNSALVPRNTPENTFGLTTSYTAQIGNGDLKARVSYRYRGALETESQNNPLGHLGSINNVNANISYTMNNYSVSVWGRNITDEREQRWSTIGGLTSRGWWNEPATYGLTLSASF